MLAQTVCILFFFFLHAAATKSLPPPCSLLHCVTKGAQAICRFTDSSGSISIIKCKKWARVDPDACPKVLCPILCPDLPKKGAACDSKCSGCFFNYESCRRRFKLFRPTEEECKALKTPSPSPVPTCSLVYCSRNGNRAQCGFSGRAIRCGKWPRLGTDVCPRFICKIGCTIPAKKGPVCSNCPDCAFLAPSCAKNFKLYRAKNCPTRSLS